MEVLERPAAVPLLTDASVIAAVRELADGPLAELASDIDRRGVYPETILKRLGDLGALSAHMKRGEQPGDYGLAIRAMSEVSRVCGATGFMVWCHEVCGVYLEQSGNPALMGDVLDRHNSGQTLGATGMSNPMKTFAGIETFLLHARKIDGGYVVNGTLPWVSNLGPDHYFGAVADVESTSGSDTAKTEIMFLIRCDAAGVELRNCPSFSAMEGTNTRARAAT